MFEEHLLSSYITYFASTNYFIAIALDSAAFPRNMHIQLAFPTVLKVRILVSAQSAKVAQFQSGTPVYNVSHG